jgi:hypothetical protein
MQSDISTENNQSKSNRRGWLRHGNPPGDFSTAPRCGAHTRADTSCRAPAMANGRCRMHGGKSTGPRTEGGRQRCAAASWKHGDYATKNRAGRRAVRAAGRILFGRFKDAVELDTLLRRLRGG